MSTRHAAATAAVALALQLAAPLALPAGAAAAVVAQPRVDVPTLPPSQLLPHLETELAAVTARAQRLAGALDQARARDGGLRRAVDELAEQQDAARSRLDARVRQVYMAGGPRLLDTWPVPQDPGTAELLRRGATSALQVEQQLVDDVSQQSASARALQARGERFRARLQGQAADVLAVQERARQLLEQA